MSCPCTKAALRHVQQIQATGEAGCQKAMLGHTTTATSGERRLDECDELTGNNPIWDEEPNKVLVCTDGFQYDDLTDDAFSRCGLRRRDCRGLVNSIGTL